MARSQKSLQASSLNSFFSWESRIIKLGTQQSYNLFSKLLNRGEFGVTAVKLELQQHSGSFPSELITRKQVHSTAGTSPTYSFTVGLRLQANKYSSNTLCDSSFALLKLCKQKESSLLFSVRSRDRFAVLHN